MEIAATKKPRGTNKVAPKPNSISKPSYQSPYAASSNRPTQLQPHASNSAAGISASHRPVKPSDLSCSLTDKLLSPSFGPDDVDIANEKCIISFFFLHCSNMQCDTEHVIPTSNDDIFRFLQSFKQDLERKIDTLKDDHAAKIESLRSDLVTRISALELEQEKALERANSLSAKQDAMDIVVSELRRVNSAVNHGLSEVLKQNEEIKKEQAEMDRAVNFIGEQYEDMRSELAEFLDTKSNVEGHFSVIDNATAAHHFHLHRLEGVLNKVQQAHLSLNLVITGFDKIDSPEDTFWGLITSLRAVIEPRDVNSIRVED